MMQDQGLRDASRAWWAGTSCYPGFFLFFALLLFGVVAIPARIDQLAGLISHDIGIMPGKDMEGFACTDSELLARVHEDRHFALQAIPGMGAFAALGACDRLDVIGPFPARLENAATDRSPVLEAKHVQMSFAFELP